MPTENGLVPSRVVQEQLQPPDFDLVYTLDTLAWAVMASKRE